MHGDAGGLMMLGMWFVWIVPIVVIAFAAWAANRSRRGNDTPLDLLKEQYARGRITRDEFLEARNDLA